MKLATYLFIVIALSILLDKILGHAGYIMGVTGVVLTAIKRLIAPFIYGFSIAYLICPIVTFFEKSCFSNIGFLKARGKRTVSILVTYILLIGCVVWLLIYFIPEIIITASNFFVLLPQNIASFESTVTQFFAEDTLFRVDSKDVGDFFNNLLSPLLVNTKDVPIMLQKILDSTVLAASTVLNAIMGIFISFYMLSDKEGFGKEIQKMIYTFFDEKKSDHFLFNMKRIHTIFQSFIVGKTIDSAIIGVICFTGLTLIKAPYTTILSLIVGLTNMIPYFGPLIGAVPSVFITLLIEPGKAIWVALFILALQQFDGIILGPKILGDSTGVSPIWIILAILVGGAVMGPVGMFLGVPIFASFKLFFTEYVNKRYAQKFFYANDTSSETKNKEIHNKKG